MPQAILIFDFGASEEAAQQARRKIEGWKQGFRLGNRVSLKFDRGEAVAEKSGKEKESQEARPSRIRLLVRLAFSDHERLSYQNWFNRIPAEEPFKSVKAERVQGGETAFREASQRFEALD